MFTRDVSWNIRKKQACIMCNNGGCTRVQPYREDEYLMIKRSFVYNPCNK